MEQTPIGKKQQQKNHKRQHLRIMLSIQEHDWSNIQSSGYVPKLQTPITKWRPRYIIPNWIKEDDKINAKYQ